MVVCNPVLVIVELMYTYSPLYLTLLEMFWREKSRMRVKRSVLYFLVIAIKNGSPTLYVTVVSLYVFLFTGDIL